MSYRIDAMLVDRWTAAVASSCPMPIRGPTLWPRSIGLSDCHGRSPFPEEFSDEVGPAPVWAVAGGKLGYLDALEKVLRDHLRHLVTSAPDIGRRKLCPRVFAHPIRPQMISRLSGEALSAAELGRELGISQAAASYHLRRLAQAGFVELVEERLVRGGRERLYRFDPDPRRTIDRLPPSLASSRGRGLCRW